MKANATAINIFMAEKCVAINDICKSTKMSKTTFNNAVAGKRIRPATLGKLAKALNVDVREIMEVEL